MEKNYHFVFARVAIIAAMVVDGGCGAQEARAEPVPLGGRLYGDFYLPTRNPKDTESREISTTAWLLANPKLGEKSYAKAILTATVSDRERAFTPGLREGYAGYSTSVWDLRLGRQIIPWGKSDVVAPTDVLSAKDYTIGNPDDEFKRIGATSVFAAATPEDGTAAVGFQLVWTPVFPQSRFLVNPSSLPANTVVKDPNPPAVTIGNSETAFKILINGNGWDGSLMAFRGWSHFPEYEVADVSTVASSTAPGGRVTYVMIRPSFHRTKVLGGDFAWTTGKWTLRAESSFSWTENGDGNNMLVQPPHWDNVVGVERPLGDDFRIQVQALWRYHTQFSAIDTVSWSGGTDPALDAINRGVASTNALLVGYQDRSRPGATFRFTYSHEDLGLESELFVMGNFTGGDYLIRPKLAYALTDSFKTSLGFDQYGGPSDRPMGAMKVYNSLFFEAKYSF